MSLKDIIAAAYENNPAAFETALNNELQNRMVAAVQSKYVSESKDEDEDMDDEDMDDDEDDDEDDEDKEDGK